MHFFLGVHFVQDPSFEFQTPEFPFYRLGFEIRTFNPLYKSGRKKNL